MNGTITLNWVYAWKDRKKIRARKLSITRLKKLYWLATGTTQGVVMLANLTANG